MPNMGDAVRTALGAASLFPLADPSAVAVVAAAAGGEAEPRAVFDAGGGGRRDVDGSEIASDSAFGAAPIKVGLVFEGSSRRCGR